MKWISTLMKIAKMMTSEQYKRWYFKLHLKYENLAIKRMIKYVRNQLKTYDSYNQVSYPQQIRQVLPNSGWKQLMADIYFEVGVLHGERISKGIKNNFLTVKLDFPTTTIFSEQWAKMVASFFRSYDTRIVTVNSNLIDDLLKLIEIEIGKGNGIDDIVDTLQNDFGKTGLYDWQLRRIARTETGTATSMATVEAFKNEPIVIDKMWISALDDRTRDGVSKNEWNHEVMNRKTAAIGENFQVPNENGETEALLYPSDIKGSAGNVINCRCTIAPAVRYEDGLPVMKINNRAPKKAEPKKIEYDPDKILGIENIDEVNLGLNQELLDANFLSKSEKYALKQWTNQWFWGLNSFVKNPNDPYSVTVDGKALTNNDKLREFWSTAIRELNSALDKLTEFGKKADTYEFYRGDNLALDRYSGFIKMIKDMGKTGGIIEYPVFMSTSSDAEMAGKFLNETDNTLRIFYNIIDPLGKGVNIAPYSLHGRELETLFRPNQQFEVVEVTDIDVNEISVTLKAI